MKGQTLQAISRACPQGERFLQVSMVVWRMQSGRTSRTNALGFPWLYWFLHMLLSATLLEDVLVVDGGRSQCLCTDNGTPMQLWRIAEWTQTWGRERVQENVALHLPSNDEP